MPKVYDWKETGKYIITLNLETLNALSIGCCAMCCPPSSPLLLRLLLLLLLWYHDVHNNLQ